MSTDLIRSAQAGFRLAFRQALLSALDATGLEGRFIDGAEPGTEECMPWLQQPGSGGRNGYWIACGLSANTAVLPALWPAGSKGGAWERWPEDLRVRGFPAAAGAPPVLPGTADAG
jgi:hypothetical protein